MTRTRDWLIGWAVAGCVAVGVGHEIADALRPPAPVAVRAACVDTPGNLFNECAQLDASQVTDRRTGRAPAHEAGPTTPGRANVPTTEPLPSMADAVIMVITGDYLWQTDGPLSDADADALLPAYRVAEATGLPCADMARTLQRTGDYRPDMRACFGEEDSPAVDVILRSVGR